MNQFIASIFAAAITFGAFSAISATMTDNTEDASGIGTSETPQIKQQDGYVDKGPAQNVTEGEYTKKNRLLKMKEKNADTTRGSQVQPNQPASHPESAVPATK